MSKVSPTIPLSHIIASDAPLLSPTSYNDAQWEQNQHQALYSPPLIDNYALNFNYGYGLPPSPPNSTGSNGTNSPAPGNHMIKMRMSPDSTSENDQLCLPTHQVFDFPEVQSPPSPESDSPSPQMLRRSLSISSSAPSKREHSPAPSVSKRPRGAGERITTKDFIPPDVSGLSKREARLVKNRAAAFLSRQRKREEFETMEVYVNFLFNSARFHLFLFAPHFSSHIVALPSLSKKMLHFAPLPKMEVALSHTQTTHYCPRSSNFVLNWLPLTSASLS